MNVNSFASLRSCVADCFVSRFEGVVQPFAYLVCLGVVFSVAWMMPRAALLGEPCMMHDDYHMAAAENVYDVFYIREYRIFGGLFPNVWKWLVPNFYATSLPIMVNSVLIGMIGVGLYCILTEMAVTGHVAVVTVLVLICHPIIDDISAWNTPGVGLVATIFVLLAFAFSWRGTGAGVVLGALMILMALGTYQLLLPVPMVVTVLVFTHKAAVLQTWEWRKALFVAAAMILGTSLYFVYVFMISPLVFGDFGDSGFRSPGKLLAEWKGLTMQTINLYLNLFFSVFSHYVGVKRALSLWYYMPLAIFSIASLVVLGHLVKRRSGGWSFLALLGVWVGLPFLAVLPLWLIPFYTEWRISFILLIPQVLVLGSICSSADQLLDDLQSAKGFGKIAKYGSRAIYAGLLIVPLAACVPVTVKDCSMRVEDYLHDRAIVDSIRAFRDTLGASQAKHQVIYVRVPQKVLKLTGKEKALMKANYVINTYSTFSYGEIWAKAMFRWYDLDGEVVSDGSVTLDTLASGEPDRVVERFHRLPYVVHLRDRSLSVVVGERQWYPWTTK